MSPGSLSSKPYFLQVAHSGQYLLPHYVSAFVVASDVKFFFPGLGSWNYSNYDSANANVINVLMKYSYASSLMGGIGPFSFQVKMGKKHRFSLQRKDGGLMLSLPGGQVVAYILSTVPKFPANQSAPFLEPTECHDHVHSNGGAHRRRRSIAFEGDLDAPNNVQELAKSLFSASGETPATFEDAKLSQVVSSEYIEGLIQDGDKRKEKISKFIASTLSNNRE